jgi:hypothetical protein
VPDVAVAENARLKDEVQVLEAQITEAERQPDSLDV